MRRDYGASLIEHANYCRVRASVPQQHAQPGAWAIQDGNQTATSDLLPTIRQQ
jgi:hypothetical protein